MLLKTLKPKAHGNDKTVMTTKLIITAFLRSIFSNSIVQAIIFSKTAITVESDAFVSCSSKRLDFYKIFVLFLPLFYLSSFLSSMDV